MEVNGYKPMSYRNMRNSQIRDNLSVHGERRGWLLPVMMQKDDFKIQDNKTFQFFTMERVGIDID